MSACKIQVCYGRDHLRTRPDNIIVPADSKFERRLRSAQHYDVKTNRAEADARGEIVGSILDFTSYDLCTGLDIGTSNNPNYSIRNHNLIFHPNL